MSVTLFISYSHKNRALVDRLRRELTSLGAAIWVDHLRLQPGTPDWDEAIRRGIQASDAVIYVASPDARKSRVVRGELAVADQYKKTVIPFWIDGNHWAEAAPLDMTPTQYIDARKQPFGNPFTQLAAACGLYASTRVPTAGAGGFAGLTRRQLVIGSVATVSIATGLGWAASRIESHGNTGNSSNHQHISTSHSPGQILWRLKVVGALGMMAVDSKYLYIYSSDSNLHAVDILTGKIAWTFATGLGSFPGQQAGTVVSNGVVYFGASDGGRSDFIALDVATRTPRWRLRFDVDNKVWVGTPAVTGGVVYFGDEQGFLYAARVSDGSILWRFTPTNPNTYMQNLYANSPVIADGRVYVARGDSTLNALDMATGRELWQFATGDASDLILAPPAVTNDTVFVGSTGTTLSALDPNTGRMAWAFGVGSDTGNGSSTPPAAANGLVYIADIFNALHAINPITGEEVWRAAIQFASGAAIANDTVYIGDGNGVRVSAYDARFGDQRWQCRTDVPSGNASPSEVDAQYTTPTVSNGVVYISSITGSSNSGYWTSTIYAISS